MATTPQFASVPVVGLGQVTAANTALNGTGTIVTVLTGSTNGTRISTVVVNAIATTTAGMVRLFVSDATNHRLVYEIPVTANTISASNPAFTATVTLNIVIPNGYSLRASTHNAETFNVTAFGANL